MLDTYNTEEESCMFIELTNNDTKSTNLINVNHIIKIEPIEIYKVGDHNTQLTRITMISDEELFFSDSYEEVLNAIMDSGSVVIPSKDDQ